MSSSEPSFKLPMDVQAIQRCIPHRYPFLFVERITELVPKESITGIRTVSASDPILQGHFPEMPILPGVVILEGLAQVSAILGSLSVDVKDAKPLLAEVSKARFRRSVFPGDVLTYRVKLAKVRGQFIWCEGEASVDGQLCASASLSARTL